MVAGNSVNVTLMFDVHDVNSIQFFRDKVGMHDTSIEK